jgi:hypothetical protein
MPVPPSAPTEPPPALVTVTVWGVSARHVPAAMLRVARAGVARGGRGLRHVHGLRFAKVLGTADGSMFSARGTDLRHWAMVAAWDSSEIADDFFAHGASARAWARDADETLHVRLRPVASRGTWSGRAPFTPVEVAPPATGAVAALTRARVKPSLWTRFSAAVPPVAADLQRHDGVLLALGVGEAPIGFQGTFSVWRSADDMRAFAYRDAAHTAAIADTDRLGWYAEELFARFDVLDVTGTYRGQPPAVPSSNEQSPDEQAAP